MKYGFFKGTKLTIKRILKCNPFGKIGYDPLECDCGRKNEKEN